MARKKILDNETLASPTTAWANVYLHQISAVSINASLKFGFSKFAQDPVVKSVVGDAKVSYLNLFF